MSTTIDGTTVLTVPINQTFWDLGGWNADPGLDNPWRNNAENAPFDQRFYLIINLAVGGTNGFFPDGNGKPWANNDAHAANNFWADVDSWCESKASEALFSRCIPHTLFLAHPDALTCPPPLQTPRGRRPS
jgi:hypothetical protein